MKLTLFAAALLAATAVPALAAPAPIDPATRARIDRVLAATPLIDVFIKGNGATKTAAAINNWPAA